MESKFLQCLGCQLTAKGVKTPAAQRHTCGKKNDKPDPKTEFLTKAQAISKEMGTYYRVDVNNCTGGTGNAERYHLRHGQYLNGYKVPPGENMWFQNRMHYYNDGTPSDKYIMIHESVYKKLVFITI